MKSEKKKQHGILMGVITLLALTLIIAVIPTEEEGAIYTDTLRLHILANSDSEADQAVKLDIRDRILEKYSAELSTAESKDEAEDRIRALTARIEADVDGWLTESGCAYTSHVEIGREWYDTREYDSFALPCGYYTSVQVMLGEADGRNWWCVMYPPLCLDIATEDTPSYSEEESALISGGGYNIKFKLLEGLSKTFSDLF